MKEQEFNKQPLPNGPTSLCFNKEEFMKPDFNVEHFVVECRRHATLDALRNDLHLYLKILQNAMIELINKDYADFVNLSTNLVGMDKSINDLIVPLNNIKMEILKARDSISETIKSIEEKVTYRSQIREKKQSIQNLMKITTSLDLMENLLGINNNTSASFKVDGKRMVRDGGLKEDDEGGERDDDIEFVPITSRISSGQMIERVATEFNRLQFYVTNCSSKPLLNEIEPRMENIVRTLEYSLEASLKEGLTNVESDVEVLRDCLRTYGTIDKRSHAENLFRELIVKDYMQEVINEQTIKSYGLKEMYHRILQFLVTRCSKLKLVTSRSSNLVVGYDFLVNAVWPEVVNNLEARTPSIFAPGNPDLFHERYLQSMDFLSRFESQCTSQASVKRLRNHSSYTAFISKWNLSVYFQIRFHEIAGSLEQALLTPFTRTQENVYNMQLDESVCLLKAVERCWKDDVYLEALCHRFWKLTLQLFSRYTVWIEDLVHELEIFDPQTLPSSATASLLRVESSSLVATLKNKMSENELLSNSSAGNLQTAYQTNLHAVAPQSISSAGNLTSLGGSVGQQASSASIGTYVSVLHDARKLAQLLSLLFDQSIKPVLSKLENINLLVLEASWNEIEPNLLKGLEPISKYIANEIACQCIAHLRFVNDIPRLFRRTNREVPNKASSYVNSSLKPLREFIDNYTGTIPDRDKTKLTVSIVRQLTDSFLNVTGEVLLSVRKMEESLKRLKAARGTSSMQGNHGVTDEDKIRMQLSLDVKEFENQIQLFGLSDIEISSLQKLKELMIAETSTSTL